MAMDQQAREAVEKVDSCHDGRELLRIAKQMATEKRYVVVVSFLKVESRVVKVNVEMIEKKLGRSIWKS